MVTQKNIWFIFILLLMLSCKEKIFTKEIDKNIKNAQCVSVDTLYIERNIDSNSMDRLYANLISQRNIEITITEIEILKKNILVEFDTCISILKGCTKNESKMFLSDLQSSRESYLVEIQRESRILFDSYFDAPVHGDRQSFSSINTLVLLSIKLAQLKTVHNNLEYFCKNN